MIGSFAEFERSMIREWTRVGLETARAQGRIGGRRQAQRQPAERGRRDGRLGQNDGAEAARLFEVHPSTVGSIVARTPNLAATRGRNSCGVFFMKPIFAALRRGKLGSGQPACPAPSQLYPRAKMSPRRERFCIARSLNSRVQDRIGTCLMPWKSEFGRVSLLLGFLKTGLARQSDCCERC